jgi:hypothetical protein
MVKTRAVPDRVWTLAIILIAFGILFLGVWHASRVKKTERLEIPWLI